MVLFVYVFVVTNQQSWFYSHTTQKEEWAPRDRRLKGGKGDPFKVDGYSHTPCARFIPNPSPGEFWAVLSFIILAKPPCRGRGRSDAIRPWQITVTSTVCVRMGSGSRFRFYVPTPPHSRLLRKRVVT